jgi:hypothetical protein
MNLKPNPVAGRVRKGISHSRFAQYSASCFVYFPATDSSTHRCDRRFLRFEHRCISVSLFRLRFSKVNSASHIRAIAIEDYTEVECQKTSARETSRRCATVRERRADARGNDGLEGHAICTKHASFVFEFGGYFDL